MIDDGESFPKMSVGWHLTKKKEGNHDWFGFHLFNFEISTFVLFVGIVHKKSSNLGFLLS
jgi:hypothetical protein